MFKMLNMEIKLVHLDGKYSVLGCFSAQHISFLLYIHNTPQCVTLKATEHFLWPQKWNIAVNMGKVGAHAVYSISTHLI